MAQRKTVDDLFVHLLSGIYSAGKQSTKALAKLSLAASDPRLGDAFKTRLEETQGQVKRIDQMVEVCGIQLERMKCVAMEGLIEEGDELVDEVERGPVLDAGPVAAAQKVEHYEIAAYGSLCAIGKQLGRLRLHFARLHSELRELQISGLLYSLIARIVPQRWRKAGAQTP
ncbi:DUF892 family protein [Paraburkholderia hospita]|uniref:DUF892 family protein n=1 Tax=Paraburkholderia hospita TaxID=169430 RepID=UPI000DEF6879|nr:DUF892 family protein [Paraburkholderia hospita]AXF06307.1 hypothetical protein CUJ88_49775 [Paraburkholderia hospita]